MRFKAFAYAGQIARARVENEWARQGLQLLDELDRRLSDSDELAESAEVPGPAAETQRARDQGAVRVPPGAAIDAAPV